MGVLAVRLVILRSLFNVFLCCFSFSMHPKLGGNETDRMALLAIKAQIKEDPDQFLSSWNESYHFCLWQGVTCSQRHHQRITRLNLGNQSLVGTISPHIGNLSFLRVLHLSDNRLSGQIPPEIGRLRRLQVLNLTQNSLTGVIPVNMSNCLDLIGFYSGFNHLVGKIPMEFGSFPKLEKLVLQRNTLSGAIPDSLGNISSLDVFAFYDNRLSGDIPSSLGQLKKLTYFSLGSNKLSGTVPPSIYNLSNLVTFSVSYNRLIQGTIPRELATIFPNLEIFNIASNQFSGSIPMSISNATNLVKLEVADNKLTGQVPNLQKLCNLETLVIYKNRLGTGTDGDLSFVSGLSNATKLRWFVIDENNFGGMLPTSLFNLSTKLKILWVEANQLYGNIPSGISNLVNLELLDMGNNHLTGNIPTDIGKLQMLQRLSLFTNKLSGRIPSTLGNLPMLATLELQGNNLHGDIPSNLGKCQRLLHLDLSQNNLGGSIPPEVLSLTSLSILFNLSRNQLTGSLPLEIGKLSSLGKLDISDNMLSGELPNSLGGCASLEVLHFQGNFFNGTIPSSLSSLRGIEDLDLSRNNLSGDIPHFLEGFAFLMNLNLSFNQLSGAVPIEGVFKNATATSVVGNTGLCSDIGNLQLPKCKNKGRLSPRFKLIISFVAGFAFLGMVIGLSLLFVCSPRKKGKGAGPSALGNCTFQVSYNTLLKATDGFSSTNLIGMGSFGSVYKGVLDDDNGTRQLVAVKVFNMLRQGASKSFIAECEAMRNIRHRNLVKVVTACSSVDFSGNDFKALVYELMENGSLEEWLHPTAGTPKNFSFLQRLDIAIDVACALDYLHNHCEAPIVHCDLKPSNVLLANDLTGLVSDFGLARFLSNLTSNVAESQTSSIGIRGTVGYAAPEYGMGSKIATCGDVYSFGILLLEMFTGKRPTDPMFSDGLNLHNFVKMDLPRRVAEIADSLFDPITSKQSSIMIAEKIQVCLSSIFKIGISCSDESPRDRKDMSDVVTELQSIRDLVLGPKLL